MEKNTAKLNVTCAFKNMDHASDNIKDYAQKKSEKFIKYLHHLITCHYVFLTEKNAQAAQVHLISGDFECRAEGHEENFYASIDAAVEKLVQQCRKHKEKEKDHSGKPHHNSDPES